ncbi:hypothetical protein EZS27_004039 [termite gut metagenome]|uniref:Uncharacterized protein n=1 Tax=termite gut metagenome TaxID=433724 RepID=A0A5J4SR77_9ZZZZ
MWNLSPSKRVAVVGVGVAVVGVGVAVVGVGVAVVGVGEHRDFPKIYP